MKLIVGNFKMNLLIEDIDNYLSLITEYNYSDVVFCPSNIYLKLFLDNNLVVGCQDVSCNEKGAFTGDVSALQMANLGVKYAIIGHSERRRLYADSELVARKLHLCLQNNLTPILCIGETKEEYDLMKTLDVLKKQIDEAFKDNTNLENVILAYEPVWSIGTGLVPSNEVIYHTIDYIKKYVSATYKTNLKVLYGGSVNKNNINSLETITNVDGYLIGGASLDALAFVELINAID